MLFDTISPIASAADLLFVEPPLDVALTQTSLPRVTASSPTPSVVEFTAGDGGDLPDAFDVIEVDSIKVRHAVLFTFRKWLVQDRDVGDSWYQVCAAIPGWE